MPKSIEPESGKSLVRTFEAKFAGPCGSECDTGIEVGDEVLYDTSGVLIHADCISTSTPSRPTETCMECFIIKPCDCNT